VIEDRGEGGGRIWLSRGEGDPNTEFDVFCKECHGCYDKFSVTKKNYFVTVKGYTSDFRYVTVPSSFRQN
jgi:hypothetical protein